MEQLYFDILVVGGGHSGLEAAYCAAYFDLKIGLITTKGHGLGTTPCNPAIGGVGKGQLVREIDALGGLMGKLADKSAIQYRTLNDSKGYAVKSTRVQVDKILYSENAEHFLSQKSNIFLIYDHIVAIYTNNEIKLIGKNGTYIGKKLIFTGGTFLNGIVHIGNEQFKWGIYQIESSLGINDLFKDVKINKKRFKTGTPPRINRESIDFKQLTTQKSDEFALNFHYSEEPFKRVNKQKSCFITNTNSKTMQIIRGNKDFAPLFNGQITGIGPRYCPSIEDKAFRYLDRDNHHIFLEPEGETSLVYPSGISTSLPKNVQKEFIHSIKGLENAKIEVFGYAVEYDIIDSRLLDNTLYFKNNIYFAGQINGTSGYEEAAAQGLVAGYNAALSLTQKSPLIFDRNESYIGVLIEDIITSDLDGPYRLFTARHENRLYVREDNAFSRMIPYRLSMQIDDDFDQVCRNYLEEYNAINSAIFQIYYFPKDDLAMFKENNWGEIGERLSLNMLLKRSTLDPVEILSKEFDRFKLKVNPIIIRDLAISIRYQGHIDLAVKELGTYQKLMKTKLNWEDLLTLGIANECKERIKLVRPTTFGQLSRITGIRSASLALVAAWIK